MEANQTAICDFIGKILTEENNQPLTTEGRVLMSERELLVVTNKNKRRIPIDAIANTKARITNSAFDSFFDQGVLIRYQDRNETKSIVIGGDSDAIATFRMKLFDVLIGDPTISVKHPYKIGGVVIDPDTKKETIEFNCISQDSTQVDSSSRVNVDNSRMKLVIGDREFPIPVSSVIGFKNCLRDVGARSDCPTLIVEYVIGDEVYATQLATENRRKLRLISQYFRQEYTQLIEDLNSIPITDMEAKALTEIYTCGGITDSDWVLSNIKSLHDKNLVELKNGTITTTQLGNVWVNTEAPDRF